MRIACLQNHPAEGPAEIGAWALRHEIDLVVFRSFAGEFPSLEDYERLVVMGGPMSVHDAASDSHIAEAIRVVGDFLTAERPTLGICLGAQMMAMASGGKVIPGPQKEIGWLPISVCPGTRSKAMQAIPDKTPVFHWHGEQITSPPQSEVLASTEACEVQAFQLRPGQVGLQFHLEVSEESINEMIKQFSDELSESGPFIQTAEVILEKNPVHVHQLSPILESFLTRWLESS
ncbi:MAG: type 1 glutamine amidotransferase [Verrucomicrobiota bacterium]